MGASSNAIHIDLENPRQQGGGALYYSGTQLERLLESPAAEERNWEKCSICRVPAQLLNQYNEKLYRPTLVSIGPYHHGQPHLWPMEVHKIRALARFLEKSGKTVDDLKREFTEDDVSALMESYEDLDVSEWSDRGKFLELLILDGNFVLEFNRSYRDQVFPTGEFNTYDPVFGIYRLNNRKALFMDIYKLENQVPFLVLEKLHCVLADSIQTTTATTTLVQVEYLDREILLRNLPYISPEYIGEGRKPMHLLDLYRTKMIGKLSTRKLPRPIRLSTQNASTYTEAGIAFKLTNTGIISELKLDVENVLFIPSGILSLEETFIANLLVYETLYCLGDLEIHSCFCFVKRLFRSVEEIGLLVGSSGLVVDTSAVAEKVLNSYKNINDGMDFHAPAESSVVTAVEQLNERYIESRKKWRRRFREWGSNFKQTYFSSPWKVLSLFGALLLLGLTFSQTLLMPPLHVI